MVAGNKSFKETATGWKYQIFQPVLFFLGLALVLFSLYPYLFVLDRPVGDLGNTMVPFSLLIFAVFAYSSFQSLTKRGDTITVFPALSPTLHKKINVQDIATINSDAVAMGKTIRFVVVIHTKSGESINALALTSQNEATATSFEIAQRLGFK